MISGLFITCDVGEERLEGSWGKGYVANYEINTGKTITVVDARKAMKNEDAIVTTINLDSSPTGPYTITANPNTWKVYVGNYNSDTVSVINGHLDKLKKTIKDVGTPYGIAVNSNINKIYSTDFLNNELNVIDGDIDIWVTKIPLGAIGACVAVNSKTNKIYVAHPNKGLGVTGGFSVIDLVDDERNIYSTYANLDAGQFSDSYGVAVNSRTNKIYLTNYGSNRISVINGTTNQVIKHIDGVARPLRVAVNSRTNKIYVSNNDSGANSVTVIDGVKDKVMNVITGFNLPRDIVINEKTNVILVSNNGNNTMTAIDGYNDTVGGVAWGFGDPAGMAIIP